MTDIQAARALRPWHLALWFVAAAMSTMCGIGGGLFAVPILHFLLGLPLRLSTTTSLVAVFAMTLTGTIAELFQPMPAIDWRIVGLLCLGGFVGANIGQRVSKRLDPRVMTWVFAICLFAAGVRVLTSAPGRADFAGISELPLDAVHVFGVLSIGFAGGFVAPLLGVGGGLIVVPALYLGLPGMTYLGARACSTAMSDVNSAQLTWMNLRDGAVHRPSLAPFAIVAALGAIAGIFLVHRPGWPEAARILLGVVLIAVSIKFAAGTR
ncbi:MAG TPA: sulfite exporter TauE/SafE family protein [Planctomycetota bacterium]|nr:sulfite exporter TauE/SafE family protein [Planctomycetota bacterium]